MNLRQLRYFCEVVDAGSAVHAAERLFVAPTAIADHVCEQYKVVIIGRIDSIVEHLYAITTERQITHPAIVAISKAARENIFGAAKS